MGAKEPGAYEGGQLRMKKSAWAQVQAVRKGQTGDLICLPFEVLLTRVLLEQDAGTRP